MFHVFVFNILQYYAIHISDDRLLVITFLVYRCGKTNSMCVNDPNGGHLNDENMVRMVDKVQHVDRVALRHSLKDQMHLLMTEVALLDY